MDVKGQLVFHKFKSHTVIDALKYILLARFIANDMDQNSRVNFEYMNIRDTLLFYID